MKMTKYEKEEWVSQVSELTYQDAFSDRDRFIDKLEHRVWESCIIDVL